MVCMLQREREHRHSCSAIAKGIARRGQPVRQSRPKENNTGEAIYGRKELGVVWIWHVVQPGRHFRGVGPPRERRGPGRRAAKSISGHIR